MSLKTQVLPPQRVAKIRYASPYSVAISEFMRAFNDARNARGWIGDSFGIALAGEAYGTALHNLTSTDAPLCRFDAAVAVSSDALIEPPFDEDSMPGGAYAIAEFMGSPFEIGAAWVRVFTAAIPASGLTLDRRPNFEWYRASDTISSDGTFTCGLCVSVKT